MKRKARITRLIITALIVSLAAILTALSPINPKETPSQASTEFVPIDNYVSARLHDLRIPGAALGIVKDGEVVHLQTFGSASKDEGAVTVTTPFKIGSMSKSFTALAVMQLVEAGKIQLDAPVQQYLPEFRVADPEASKRITVRHLLNQVSGIPTSAGMNYVFRTDTGEDALEREVARSKNVKLTHEPGTTFQYSNRNYTTLGLLIKVVSGQSYEDYVQAHVLQPLGMQQSFTPPRRCQEPRSRHRSPVLVQPAGARRRAAREPSDDTNRTYHSQCRGHVHVAHRQPQPRCL